MRPSSSRSAEPLWRALTRRSFVASLLGGSLAGAARLLARRAGLHALGSMPRGAEAAVGAAGLAAGELETLRAFGFVLVPSSFAAPDGARADATRDVIDATLRGMTSDSPDLVRTLRAGAAVLDARSGAAHGTAFAVLDGERRRRLVEGLLRPYTTRNLFSNPYYYLTEDGRRVRSLWSTVAQPVIAGFYTSRLGWQIVGYPRRPGECSNLTDYQLPAS